MARALTVLSGGHPFEEPAFDALLSSLMEWRVTHLRHPDAETAVAEGALKRADAVLFYDMPGYAFVDGKVESRPPSEGFKAAIGARFAAGRGAVAMHHALAGWPDWPQWAEWLGGRFLYQPGEFRGRAVPDSGYRHDVAYTGRVVARHPVTAGLPDEFDVTDELYLAEIDEGAVHPLVRARYNFERENFYSAAMAVRGKMLSNAGWEHPPGSNLVAWWKPVGAARLVYLQFGDGPATYTNPHVRRLLANALEFAAGAN